MSFSSDIPLQSNQLPLSIDFPEDPGLLRETLESSYKRTVGSMNTKVGGLYSLEEIAAFKQLYTLNTPFTFRNVYRKTFAFSPADFVGNTATIPHGITGITDFLEMYGAMFTTVPDWRPLPFVSATSITDQVSLKVTSTNIIIVLGATAMPIVRGTVVLEYVKD